MINKTKILLIRFSSFGDVVQCLSLPTVLKNQFPNSEIHWITKTDFTGLIETHPAVNKVWELNKKKGFRGLLKLIRELRNENFSLIYDAHNNLRSHVIVWGLNRLFANKKNPKSLSNNNCESPMNSYCLTGPQLIRRSIFRWKRFLLFNFRINLFQQPFSGQRDLLIPLSPWGISAQLPPAPQLFIKETVKTKILELIESQGFSKNNFISLAPSAAHELKKWPKEYWQQLVKQWPVKFIILGGPSDHFLADIATVAPERIVNLAGQLSLEESAAVIAHSQLLITNDTGLLHVAEQLGQAAVALMGPAPFGYPSRYDSTMILEKHLSCKPCSKHGQGPCRNPNFQECLRGINPQFVMMSAQKHLATLNKLR
jgi:ADP-heptose:LPS heptosyltransferase